ncbi:hypothetical protein CDAR_577621 [Caerostris darwini]|uniref:Uncharacterized protein n=1 Tax=Caerostris darwini TaxID=1538125 RepID=A0AAV4USQ0_9ARAC|nr:hypothetical protein CDAR_577621 [Caerostris darwini]
MLVTSPLFDKVRRKSFIYPKTNSGVSHIDLRPFVRIYHNPSHLLTPTQEWDRIQDDVASPPLGRGGRGGWVRPINSPPLLMPNQQSRKNNTEDDEEQLYEAMKETDVGSTTVRSSC